MLNSPSFFGNHHAAEPDSRFECSICWWLYDPEQGDASRQIPAATPFAKLPDDWCCPGCDASRDKFTRASDTP